MPPRLIFPRAYRSLAVRTRPLIARPRILQISSRRGFADGKEPRRATEPNQDGLGNVSEEARDIGKVTGEVTPDLEQGTPVQDVRSLICCSELESFETLPLNITYHMMY